MIRRLPVQLPVLAFATLSAVQGFAQQAPAPLQLTPGSSPTTQAAPLPPQRPATPPASSQNAPVPPAWAAPAQAPGQARTAPPQAAAPSLPPPPAATPVATGSLSTAQVQTLRRITESYNATREMNGRFTQVEANGRRTTGRFFISKPGKIRFVYDRPSRLDIIADGRDLVVRDRGLNTQDLYPLSQTPLRYLLNDRIDLTRDAKVVNVFNDQDMVSVTIEERTQFTEGQLTLYFDASDFALRQWTITDARGNETSVAVEGVSVNQRNNPNLFEIDRSIQVGPQNNR